MGGSAGGEEAGPDVRQQQQQQQPTTLQDLPKAVMLSVLGHLDVKDLGRLAVQDRQLNGLIEGEAALWERLSLKKWPYSGGTAGKRSWKSMYGARMRMPPAFLQCLEKCLALRADTALSEFEGGSPELLRHFSAFMKSAFGLFLAVELTPHLRDTQEYRAYLEAQSWWDKANPEILHRYVERSDELAQEYDMWGVGFVNWPDIPWRRSVLQFVIDSSTSASQSDVLKSLVDSLDNTIRSVVEEAENLRMPAPKGLPLSHWWYFTNGSPYSVSHVC